MSKIFVVEDDQNILELILYALKSSSYEAYGFETANALYNELNSSIPDLILLDIMLPDEDGLKILKALRERQSTKDTAIIMLTAKSSEFDKIKGLDLGADDYITKPFSVLELISRIKAVLRRSNNLSQGTEVLTFADITMDMQKHTVNVGVVPISLTLKEFDLLKLLIINKGIVLSRDKLMDKVWGFDYEGESRTIDMHIKTLRQKLLGSGKLIKTIRSIGYKIDA